MIPVVKEDILLVLKDVDSAIARNDVSALKLMSDRTIHNSSIFQDEDSITIAVVIYSLSKIAERGIVKLERASGFVKHALRHLKRDELHRYKAVMKRLSKFISDNDFRFKIYVQDVIDKAQVAKGSRIYYHGISLAQAANILGISQWDLMGYVGKTKIIDSYGRIGNVKDRLNLARRLFIK
ncbi:hypothetical protein HY640_02805 [Candidatus Woesearchaeota archaeon]|nr:hypothetical protein [Candidatus Woesearchaeota archaeon]